MRRCAYTILALLAGGTAAVAGASPPGAERAASPRWRSVAKVAGVVDIVGPRRDGRFVVAGAGRLSLLSPGRPPVPFARGPRGYARPPGGEPYITLAPARRLPPARCSFRHDDVYAIAPDAKPSVIRVDQRGRATRFAGLPAGGFPSGLAFDTVGKFGHRLLVTVRLGETVSVLGFDCRGRRRVFVRNAPKVEGGIAVAPRSFGRHAGRLIAPDELTGRVLWLGARGGFGLVARSGLAKGPDTGVESLGFVPRGFGRGDAAYIADFGVPGNPFSEGTDSILALSGLGLSRAGVQAGDLLVATETGARTITVRCAQRCRVRRVANGPDVTHAEGHISFGPAP